MAEKKTVGRKKSPTIKRLEGTINRLNRELEAAKAPKQAGENLNKDAFGLSFNRETKTYYLNKIKYNSETKEAMVVEVVSLGDFQPRVLMEVKKIAVDMLTNSLKEGK